MRRALSGIILAISGLIGALAFAYPFLLGTGITGSIGIAHGQDAPLVTTALVGLLLISLVAELQGQTINAKMVAALGVLIAIASVLRFIEVAFPIPGGFSPVFVPIILAGYVFGGRFGFLMGAFTLLTSGLVTGGVGPWLPYQMFVSGWVGMSAGWLARLTKRAARSHQIGRVDSLMPSVIGFVWGLLYGVIMNVYFWPYASGPTGQSYALGISLKETLVRYAGFYVTTSLGWDLARAVGNVVIILLLGTPIVRALTRFRHRFHFEVHRDA